MRRMPRSLIICGPSTEFRSAAWSNPAGINRPCLLNTRSPRAVIRVGTHCGLSATVISSATSVTLGDHVFCGANVTITDSDMHPIDAEARVSGKDGDSSPVVIEDYVWLGLNVTVLKGVTIGRGTVVAAGSVVSRSLPSGVIAAGQPAVPIRKIEQPTTKSGKIA